MTATSSLAAFHAHNGKNTPTYTRLSPWDDTHTHSHPSPSTRRSRCVCSLGKCFYIRVPRQKGSRRQREMEVYDKIWRLNLVRLSAYSHQTITDGSCDGRERVYSLHHPLGGIRPRWPSQETSRPLKPEAQKHALSPHIQINACLL